MQPWATIYAIRNTQYAIRNTRQPSSVNGTSTSVEKPLQINPFYAKQTQFPKKSNDVSIYLQTDYENKRDWTIG